MWLDHCVAAGLVLVALWILISGLDDLFISFAFFLMQRRERLPWPSEMELARAPQRRIAILVPLWHEQDVIGQMLQHNLSVILYNNYEIFVGVYPNDQPTVEAARQVARDDGRVHVAVCPHDGPLPKATA